MILFQTQEIKFNIRNKRILKKWISTVAKKHNLLVGDLNFIFTTDENLLNINRKYLNHDYYTDVITFNYNYENYISGDIFISIERVRENSKKFSNSFIEELLTVIIHGVLHLIGFDDHSENEQKEMRTQEKISLELINYKELKW